MCLAGIFSASSVSLWTAAALDEAPAQIQHVLINITAASLAIVSWLNHSSCTTCVLSGLVGLVFFVYVLSEGD